MACGSQFEDNDIPTEEKEFQEKWSRFSDWLHCICVVTFDLELGQAMESVYPPGVKLTDQEKCNICYLAFPDSNSGCMGDTQFHVRLRCRAPLSPQQLFYNEDSVPTLRADPTHYWGFVYFRQVKDPSLPRGYFQKSIILLTRLPFTNLFYKVIQLIAPKHFEEGENSLEAACHDINRWPVLEPGHNVLLPILGTVFQSYIPNQQTGKITRSDIAKHIHSTNVPHVLASIQDVNVFDAMSSLISHLHLLWELVLTAEPIVVMASSPTECSALVQALTFLIQPLPYAAEYRPYFTIHDSEFKEFTRKQFNPPCVILGVTNPFFTKTLQHWPHTIKLGDPSAIKTKLRKVGNMKLLDTAPGIYTQYKTFLEKDKTIIKKLHNGIRTDRPSEVQTAMVKRHLLELTQSFMIPLERYMASLMPLQKNISPFRAPPVPNPFNPEDFFTSLQQAGPQLTSGIKGDWIGLYKSFFRSPNFSAWFHQRHSNLTNKLHALQLEALAESDLKKWSVGKKEVEIVDMVLKLREVLKSNPPVADNTRTLLARRLEDLNCVLPEDMKSISSGSTQGKERKLLSFCPNASRVLEFLRPGEWMGLMDDDSQSLKNSLINLWTILNINPEPAILQAMPISYEWPLPTFRGCCGRVVEVSYEGAPLTSLFDVCQRRKLEIAANIIKAAMDLTFQDQSHRFYLMDWSPTNVLVNEMNEVTITNLKRVVIFDVDALTASLKMCFEKLRKKKKTYKNDKNLMKLNYLCSENVSDHNIREACSLLIGGETPFLLNNKSEVDPITVKLLKECRNGLEGITIYKKASALVDHLKSIVKSVNNYRQTRFGI